MPYFVGKFYKFFPPLAFATAPKGGSNPLEHLPVGVDLLSCKKQAVNGGKIYFATFFASKKSKPLTACFVHGFCKSPTEHLPRGRAVGTRPTRGVRGFPLTSGNEKPQSGCPFPMLASEHFRTECANLEVSIFQNLPSLLVDFFSFVRMDISSFFLPCVGFYNLLDYPTTS